MKKPDAQIFAMKVIVKKELKDKMDQEQLINEIKIQRALALCPNVLKIHKVYESDRYLNLLMEF